MTSDTTKTPLAGASETIRYPPMPRIPDYTEVRPLARGGFGTVYLARDVTGNPCALKVVTSTEVGDNYRYEREYESVCKHRPISGQHPSLLQILHVGKGEGFFYYTMPLADGMDDGPVDFASYRPKTLSELIRQHNGAMPIKDAIEAILPVLNALHFLHGKGLLHRDVKPDNILFLNSIPVLGDIGLVTEPKQDMTVVNSGRFSPPQGVVDEKGDLYSVGVTLFAAVGGDVSRPGISVPTIFLDDISGLYPSLNRILVRAQERKFGSSEAMRKELEKLLGLTRKAKKRCAVASAHKATPIEDKYDELKALLIFLGDPIHEERVCSDGIGRYRSYMNEAQETASIYWHPKTGAFSVQRGIRKHWQSFGAELSFLGYPVADEGPLLDSELVRLLSKTDPALPEAEPQIIGSKSIFQGGLVVCFNNANSKAKFGEYAAFCRPRKRDPWIQVIKDKPKNNVWSSALRLLSRKVSHQSQPFIHQSELELEYAAEVWSSHLKSHNPVDPRPSSENAFECAGPADLSTADNARSKNSSPLIKKIFSSSTLLDAVDPKWTLVQDPDELKWSGFGGYLYRLSTPDSFASSRPKNTYKSLLPTDVAFFMPPNCAANATFVYCITEDITGYINELDDVKTIFGCGCGIVLLTMPKVETQVLNPLAIGKKDDAIKATLDAGAFMFAVNRPATHDALAGYHLKTVMARNLWLAKRFLQTEFRLKPRKDVLVCENDQINATLFAFAASGFGDVMLVLNGSPLFGERLHNTATFKAPGFHFQQKSFTSFSDADCCAMLSDPLNYVDAVKPPRECHILLDSNWFPIDSDIFKTVFDKHMRLQGIYRSDFQFTEDNRAFWKDQMRHNLSQGKSIAWFKGNPIDPSIIKAALSVKEEDEPFFEQDAVNPEEQHLPSDWNEDLFHVFFETKLRLLNGLSL